MANLVTTEDIVKFVEFRAGEVDTGTSSLRPQILLHCDEAQRAILAGGRELNVKSDVPIVFSWARSLFQKVIILKPIITQGTVRVTKNNAIIVFDTIPVSSEAPSTNISVIGYHFQTLDDRTTYGVIGHTAGSVGATLDSVYVGATNLTASYRLFQVIYSVGPDVLRLFSPLRVHQYQVGQDSRQEIDVMPMPTFQKMYPTSCIADRMGGEMPTKAAVYQYDGDGTWFLQMNSYTNDIQRVEIDYVPTPTPLAIGSVDPILPVTERGILAEYALWKILGDVDDDRADAHFNAAVSMFEAMVRKEQIIGGSTSGNFGRIRPRMDKATGVTRRGAVRTEDGFLVDV